jgi:hypothetical protein
MARGAGAVKRAAGCSRVKRCRRGWTGRRVAGELV